jgi:hypothetical protein
MELIILFLVFIAVMTGIVIANKSAKKRIQLREENFQKTATKFGLKHSMIPGILENKNFVSGELDGCSIRIYDNTKGAGKYQISWVTVLLEPNPFAYDFTIERKGFYPLLRKLSGSKEFEIGSPDFDHAFMVTSSNAQSLINTLNEEVQKELLSIEESLIGIIKSDPEGFIYEIKNGFNDEGSRVRFERVINLMRLLIANRA